jgi:acetylornithine/succinyldiaminopimelate/putrescine aminotransferase
MNENYSPFVAKTSPSPYYIKVSHAEGLYIYDSDGKRYFDMISGIAVSNLGHRHPDVVAAVKQQLDRYMHVIPFGEFGQEPQEELAKLLVVNLPDLFEQVYFVNSGTEANEGALKLARRYTGRSKLIAFRGAYHGGTMGSLSVTGNEMKKYPFRPLIPDVYHIRYNHFDDLDMIDDGTAAVIAETIQGDAGVRIPDIEWMQALRKRCSETGALLILDEIQTGFGRTGKLFAFEHFGIVPDIITMAKGMGGGMPIGAFAASRKVMETLTFDPPLGHITTFGGHPVNCAAGLATLKVLTQTGIIQEAERKGAMMQALLKHKLVKEIRRKGLMFAIQMESAEVVQRVVQQALQNGIISFWFLSCPDSFRIAPPLTITDAEITESCRLLISAMDKTV